MVNILLSSDQNYFRYLFTTILSVIQSASNDTIYKFYIIDNGINEDSKKALKQLISENRHRIVFLNFKTEIDSLDLKCNFPDSAFGRLFVGRIEGLSRVIYLDCDMIVKDDLSSLWNEKLYDNVLGAVQDSVNSYFLESIGISKKARYINSGMLLINVDAWRSMEIEQRAFEYIRKMNGNVPHNDQGVINAVCEGKIEILDCRYNMQNPMFNFKSSQIKKMAQIECYYSEEDLVIGKENPCVIHFTEEFYNRPWCINCTHPMKEEFDKIWKQTEWGSSYEKKGLSRNAAIMQWVNLHLPFVCYCIMMRVITIKKEIQSLRR